MVSGHYGLNSIEEVNTKIIEVMAAMENHTVEHFTWMGTGTSGIPNGIPYNANHWMAVIYKLHANNYGIVEMESYGTGTGYKVRAIVINGVLGDWEWENPPMALGIEYRTTERYLGNPVYTKLIDYGSMPNSTAKRVQHGASVKDVKRCSGYVHTACWTFPSPSVTMYADASGVSITTTGDFSAESAYVQIWYTKA